MIDDHRLLTPAEQDAWAAARQAFDFAVLARWAERGGEPTILELDVLQHLDPDSIHVRDAMRRAWERTHPPAPPFWRPPHPTASESEAEP